MNIKLRHISKSNTKLKDNRMISIIDNKITSKGIMVGRIIYIEIKVVKRYSMINKKRKAMEVIMKATDMVI